MSGGPNCGGLPDSRSQFLVSCCIAARNGLELFPDLLLECSRAYVQREVQRPTIDASGECVDGAGKFGFDEFCGRKLLFQPFHKGLWILIETHSTDAAFGLSDQHRSKPGCRNRVIN